MSVCGEKSSEEVKPTPRHGLRAGDASHRGALRLALAEILYTTARPAEAQSMLREVLVSIEDRIY
jgi:hypothetical protein